MAMTQQKRAPKDGALFCGALGQVQRTAYRHHDAKQNPYSIDGLSELPALHRRFLPLAGQILSDVLRPDFREATTGKRGDKPLCPHTVPQYRLWLNPLRNCHIPVSLPETAVPFGTTSCRH